MKKPLKIEAFNQIGFIVRDVEKAAKSWEALFGIGPFQILERAPEETIYKGKKEIFQIKNALARIGSLQLELVEVIQGNCCQKDFLEESGGGLHHLAVFVEDIDEALNVVKEHGIEVLQSGTAAGSIRFAYLDTKAQLGFVLEFMQLGKPKKRKER